MRNIVKVQNTAIETRLKDISEGELFRFPASNDGAIYMKVLPYLGETYLGPAAVYLVTGQIFVFPADKVIDPIHATVTIQAGK